MLPGRSCIKPGMTSFPVPGFRFHPTETLSFNRRFIKVGSAAGSGFVQSRFPVSAGIDEYAKNGK